MDTTRPAGFTTWIPSTSLLIRAGSSFRLTRCTTRRAAVSTSFLRYSTAVVRTAYSTKALTTTHSSAMATLANNVSRARTDRPNRVTTPFPPAIS